MKVEEFTTFDRVEETIQIQVQQDRSVLIPSIISGYKVDQVFTSNDLPEVVTARYIGLAKDKRKGGHPTYIVEPTTKILRLRGENGYDNGPGILNRICRTLFSDEGVLTARSVKKSDLKRFDYKHENYRYWIASNEVELYDNTCEYNLYKVRNGRISYNRLYNLQGINQTREGAVRAVIVLQTKVTNTENRSDIKWIEL